jgi:hypothetical protein
MAVIDQDNGTQAGATFALADALPLITGAFIASAARRWEASSATTTKRYTSPPEAEAHFRAGYLNGSAGSLGLPLGYGRAATIALEMRFPNCRPVPGVKTRAAPLRKSPIRPRDGRR